MPSHRWQSLDYLLEPRLNSCKSVDRILSSIFLLLKVTNSINVNIQFILHSKGQWLCACVFCAFNSCGIVKISRARQNNVQRLRANLMLNHSYCSKGISCSLTKFNFHNQFKQVIIYMFYEAQKPLSIYFMKLNEKKCI